MAARHSLEVIYKQRIDNRAADSAGDGDRLRRSFLRHLNTETFRYIDDKA